MKKMVVVALAAILVVGGWVRSQDVPKPQKEHEWLKQLEGEWEADAETVMAPGQPPVKGKWTESIRSLGGFWTVAEMKGDCMGMSMTGLMTVGYDTQKKKYVGNWVCSMCDWHCQYEGSIDGKVLTLNCEGPNPETGKTVKMRDVIEFKDKDTKVMTSSMLGADGKWVPFMTMTAKRKK